MKKNEHTRRRVAVVYHRVDFDGIVSYAVCKTALEESGCAVTGVPYNYGDDISAVGLHDFDEVFIVDATLPPERMKLLRSETRLVWIDHHATSISDSMKNGYDSLPGIRAIGRGACELCWEYFHEDIPVPMLVRLISAYDVWDKRRFDWEGLTLPFQYGMRNRYNLDAERFVADFCHDPENAALTDRIMSEGLLLVGYIRSTGRRSCGAYGFEVTLAGRVRALCMLTATFGSIPMEEAARELGCEVIVCANRRGPDQYQVSCYAFGGQAPIHLGNYLRERYGGGGHEGAAGAVVGKDVFDRLLTECVL